VNGFGVSQVKYLSENQGKYSSNTSENTVQNTLISFVLLLHNG
jgi:hypothetical protein